MFQPRITLHRLFFALSVPLPLARQLALIAAQQVSPRDAVAAGRLHLTLFILDDRATADPALIEALRRVGATVRLAAFGVMLERMIATDRSVAMRPRGRHAALEELYDQLDRHCRVAGMLPRRQHRFSPHVTLGYRPFSPRNEAIAPVGWHAAELVLIDSHVGRTRHEVLGRWALIDEPPRQLSLL